MEPEDDDNNDHNDNNNNHNDNDNNNNTNNNTNNDYDDRLTTLELRINEALERNEVEVLNRQASVADVEEELDRRITTLMNLLFQEGLLNRGNARRFFNNNDENDSNGDDYTPTTMTSIDGNGIDTN